MLTLRTPLSGSALSELSSRGPQPSIESPPIPPELTSRDLLRGQREVIIRHAGQVYRLRHTRNDKLILTK